MHHQRCEIDRRAVRIRLTDKGRRIRDSVAELFERHAAELDARQLLTNEQSVALADNLRRVERYWTEQIRFIY
jgi:DNA-binding MarR family transcriptional regulator